MAVREDLPTGLLAAQVTHAAGESSPGDLPAGTHAVVLGCTAQELSDLLGVLRLHSVGHTPIIENDPPYTGQLLAIGIRPDLRARIRPFVKKLRLLSKSSPDVVRHGRGEEDHEDELRGLGVVFVEDPKKSQRDNQHKSKNQADRVNHGQHAESMEEVAS